MEWVILLLVAALVGGAVLIGWLFINHLENKRRERIAQEARNLQLELHWGLLEQDRQTFHQLFEAKRGRNHKIIVSLVADDEQTRITLFDYSFITGSGKSQVTHRWVVSLCRDADLNAPDVQLKPATFLSRIGTLFGVQDIKLPDAPELSKAFVIQGREPDRIRSFLHAGRQAAFLQQPKLSYALRGKHLLIIREKSKLDGSNIKPLLSESFSLVKAMRQSGETQNSSQLGIR